MFLSGIRLRDCMLRKRVVVTMPLSTAKEMPWETMHNPVLTFRFVYSSPAFSPAVTLFLVPSTSLTMLSVSGSGANT